MYKKYEDTLLEYMERFEEWNDESCNVIFWYGVYDSEEEKEKIIMQKDKIIMQKELIILKYQKEKCL